MTTALKNVFEKIKVLSSKEQNAVAGLLSEELVWHKSFYKSQKQLSFLAAEALIEYRSGKTKPMSLK